jgi:hypothetical protein
MLEFLMVLGGVLGLAGLALLALTVPPLTLAYLCLGMLAAGFMLGVPAGFYYHLLLRRELLRLGELPRDWYIRPFRYHELLEDDALARLRPWWSLGGFGFLLIVIALALSTIVLVTQGSRA